jgi:sterol desaturase/sphingolipid hydroxylase (fatty acid hydroxylase superfamily)
MLWRERNTAISSSPELAYQLARATTLGAAILLGLALERWRPHAALRPAWATNLGLWLIGSALTATLCGACGWLMASWAQNQSLGLLTWLDVGGPIAVAVGILGLDAVSYVWHRANHLLPLLWRFHRVHHADESFHVTTALRFHPGELLLGIPVRLVAVVALGVPPEGVLVFELVYSVANLLEHGNFDLPRRLDPTVQQLLITPAVHRAHHSSDWQALNTNFGTIFSFWDRLAGTFRPSDGDQFAEAGLPGRKGGPPPSLTESLMLPLRNAPEQGEG